MRIFNKNEELFLWRSNDTLKGRHRKDMEGKVTWLVEADQVLWGTEAKALDNKYSEITEKRGTKLVLPIIGLNVDEIRLYRLPVC
jgi:CRISPR-associated protein (TIGR03984 family)